MSSRRARVAVPALVVALAAVVAGAVPAAARQAAGPQMAALGDSYASGVGTGTYYQESGACKRSPLAYPVLDSQRIGAALTFVACSGATTGDVETTQLGALSADTDDVTVTVGGNDVGFADVISECALPSWLGDCFDAVRAARLLTKTQLPGSLATLYGDIAADAPNADVVVVGYPRLFNGTDCSALTWFTPREMKVLNSAADLLDKTIRASARAAGFGYVDPRADFTGHEICDAAPWLNDLTYPVDESFHPNVSGQAAYADLVQSHL